MAELSGRMVELSGRGASAVLTAAAGLVLEAQQAGEPVAWIARQATFFPPDLAESGIDLEALVVVRIEAGSHDRALHPALRATEHLLRSGAFGLVVLDLGRATDLSLAAQSRLGSLAQKHDSALLCLTEKDDQAPSLGSLVSLRATAHRQPLPGQQRFLCKIQVLKDKRRGPRWVHTEVCRGPTGLR
jgi:recombination protein RecA